MKIGIIGCGWLGFPLAKILIEKGHNVYGTTTSPEKLKVLSQNAIGAFLIAANETGIEGDIQSFLKPLDVLIINIPPRLRGRNRENYVSKIKHLVHAVEKSPVKKVLFIGSTAIYANDNSIVTEDTIPKPETESGIQLLEVEKLLSMTKHFKSTFLRFGGLFGAERHPANFLSGKKNVANPLAPVNLIHLTDCIRIITAIINNDAWGEQFNAAHPVHPLKQEYYTQKALFAEMEPPEFNTENASRGKTIDPGKLLNKFRYKFKVDL